MCNLHPSRCEPVTEHQGNLYETKEDVEACMPGQSALEKQMAMAMLNGADSDSDEDDDDDYELDGFKRVIILISTTAGIYHVLM